MNQYIDNLLYEFRGEQNSFLFSIRCNLEWSHNTFVNLVQTMRIYCINRKMEEKLDKEIAEGFWFISFYVKEWTSHEDFRKINNFSNEYYNQSYEIINNLAYWYFTQECPFLSEGCFDEEIKELKRLINKI